MYRNGTDRCIAMTLTSNTVSRMKHVPWHVGHASPVLVVLFSPVAVVPFSSVPVVPHSPVLVVPYPPGPVVLDSSGSGRPQLPEEGCTCDFVTIVPSASSWRSYFEFTSTFWQTGTLMHGVFGCKLECYSVVQGWSEDNVFAGLPATHFHPCAYAHS